jgi:parallel beta-helix repeat protein
MRKGVKVWVLPVVLMVMSLFALLASTESCTESNMIYVPNDYENIQWAVDNAMEGDTIIVRDGTYNENVDINVANLTIRSENGSANCIVQATDPDDYVFEVTEDYVNISWFTVKNANGIHLSGTNHCNLSDNIAWGIISIDYSNSNLCMNNTASFTLRFSNSNVLNNNNASNSLDWGISLGYSNDNNLKNNIVNSNEYGIDLSYSSNNTLTNNRMSDNNYNLYVVGACLSNYIQNMDFTNKVDGKPVYYWINQQNRQIPDDAGYVGVVNSANVTVKNVTLTNNGQGVLFAYTSNSKIENVSTVNNFEGIFLDDSSNNIMYNNNVSNNVVGLNFQQSSYNSVINNTANSNRYHGILLPLYSHNNMFISNNISKNGDGIHLINPNTNNTFKNNIVSHNWRGIDLEYSSSNNEFTRNIISNNHYCGICIDNSNSNVIYLNDFINNTQNVNSINSTNIWNSTEKRRSYVIICGEAMENYLGNYWSDYNGTDLDPVDGIGDTPYIFCFGQDNYPLMQPFGEYVINLDDAISPIVTILSPINGSRITNPVKVIGFATDDLGIIALGFGYSCWWGGGGGCQSLPNTSTNVSFNWTLYLFSGSDSELEGELPDPMPTPSPSPKPEYLISVSAMDRAGNWGRASVRVTRGNSNVFDTGQSKNPYPSVSGTHNGTIRPNETITVRKLYTYTCEGTGGHTKSIELYENTVPIASGVWSGYQGDWHNITLVPEVTLLKDHEYLYVIETGSYPQIIHAESKDVTSGRITCEELVDVNGKRHEGWIPAIKLY